MSRPCGPHLGVKPCVNGGGITNYCSFGTHLCSFELAMTLIMANEQRHFFFTVNEQRLDYS